MAELEISQIAQAIPFAQNGMQAMDDTPAGIGHMMFTWMANGASDVPPYWSRARDIWLRDFVIRNGALKTATSTFVNKAVTVPVSITPRDRSITRHVNTAQEIETGLLRNSGSMSSTALKGFKEAMKMGLFDYLCLYGRSRVHLGGDRRGQTKSIQDIVRDRDEGPVLSVDATGHIVERKIVEWHATPLGDRRWWWLSLKDASTHSGHHRGGLWMTEDHPLLTLEHGWIMARDVRVGMHVATGDPTPSAEQNEVLVGMLLGDAAIGRLPKRSILRMSHSIDQKKWFEFKQSILSGFQWTGYSEYRSDKRKSVVDGRDLVTIGANTRASLGLNDLRASWYPNGRKVVDRSMIETHFGFRSLAVWFCDDGSLSKHKNKNGEPTRPGAMLYTNGFTKSDCEWLAGFLAGKGFPCKVVPMPGGDKTYYALDFAVDGAEKLFMAIGPYVPPSMRYKLPDHAPAYDPALWNIEPAQTFYDQVRASETRRLKTGRTGEVQTTYHIGVDETRNFIAGNMVVHNTQDNGAFWCVMGNGAADGPIVGRPSGILHLDAARCIRTKNAEFPVKYEHTDGKQYILHYTRVIEMASLPSPSVYLNGVGLCPVSCCIEAAQELWDIYQYNAEMFGSHPPRQILYAKTGATIGELTAAVAAWEIKLRELNRTRFGGTMLIAPKSPNQNFELDVLSLANMPEGFNRRDVTTINKSEIAAAFGLDLRDLSYLMGAPSRTGDAEVQDRKGRGKGVGEFIETFAKKFEERYLNTELFEIRFDYLDDEQDEQESLIRDKLSTARERDLRNGVTTVRIEREIMWERGELGTEQFEDMELSDGRLPNGLDVMLLFQSADRQFTEWLNVGIPDPTNIKGNDPTKTVDAIHQKIIEVSQLVNAEGNPKQARKARQALAALEKLSGMYEESQQAAMATLDENGNPVEPSALPGQPQEDAPNPALTSKEKELSPIDISDVDDIIGLYDVQFKKLAQDALEKNIAEDQFREALAALITAFILALFQRGSKRSFLELMPDEQLAVSQLIQDQTTAISGLATDIYAGKYTSLADLGYRIDLWMNSAVSTFYAGQTYDTNDPHLMWMYGPTEHCGDCERLNGQIHTVSEWRASGWIPRSRALECQGYNCQCRWIPASGPSLGSF